MIAPSQTLLIWCILLLVTWFGIYGERVGWFRKISGALIIILATSLLVTAGFLPSAAGAVEQSPTYGFILTYFIPLSIPLLLFNVQLKKIIKETGTLLLPFLIGSLGVVLGALLASRVVPLGDETYKVAGTFTGTYTGGSVNFMAVATALDFLESPLFPSTITVDNVFTNFYIILLFLLPGIDKLIKWLPSYEEGQDRPLTEPETLDQPAISLLEQFTLCLLITGGIFALAAATAPLLVYWLDTEIDLEILLITLYIIILVNIFPVFFARYQEVAFQIGLFLMYMFLAVIGAASNLADLFGSVPGILIFASIVLLVHLLVSLSAAKLLQVSLKEILVASCANAGGPSVAAPMAASFGMKKAVTPAILIGLLGYVLGTFLGVGVGLYLQ